MFRWGTVKEVDGQAAKVKVDFLEDGVESWWLQVLQIATLGAKLYALPRVGTLVAILMDETGDDGVVVGAAYNAKDPVPTSQASLLHVELEDGTTVVLDPVAKLLTVNAAGRVEITAAATVRVIGAAVEIEGPTTIKGSLDIQGDVTVNGKGHVSGDWKADGETSPHHRHPLSTTTAEPGP